MKFKETYYTLIGVIGVLALISIIKSILQDDTEIISERAINILKDKEKANELKKIVDKYHQSGSWDKNKLQEII